MPAVRILVVFAGLIAVSGCVTPGPLEVAADAGFRFESVDGDGFVHMIARRAGQRGDAPLHVYIEGDGIPWEMGRVPAKDPTPQNALALRLAALDDHDVVYVGRPCYFGHATDPGCDVRRWTSERYGDVVVESMAAVVRKVTAAAPERPFVLIGHSGGGTLASLIANRVDGELAVVGVAANLDIDAWTRHHGYEPLAGSLNPARLPRNAPEVPHIQVAGGDDEVVPESVTLSYRSNHPELVVWSYPGLDHACCWEERWLAIVDRLYAYLDKK